MDLIFNLICAIVCVCIAVPVAALGIAIATNIAWRLMQKTDRWFAEHRT